MKNDEMNALCNIDNNMLTEIRSFLTNRERIEFICTCKRWNHLSTSVFHSLTVFPTDDLMMNIRRYIHHKQTLKRTVLIQMNVDEEWPFETTEMVVIGCKKKTPFSPKVQKVTSLRYQYQWSQ